MRSTIEIIFNKLERAVIAVFNFMGKKWVKITIITLLLLFSISFIHNQFVAIKKSIIYITLDFKLLLLSSLISMLTLFLSVFSWKNTIAAFGYNLHWIDLAHAQMISMVGKYVPGHIWNYSSKIYFSYKLGLPIKLSGVAVIIEMLISYLISIIILFLVIPREIILINDSWFLLIRIMGTICTLLIVLSPFIFTKYLKNKLSIKFPKAFIFVIATRAVTWVLSSYAFKILILSLGYPNISLSVAISAITSSYFVGFIAIFAPDGLIIREALIIFFLQNVLTITEATLISLIFRLQLILVEFLSVLFILITVKIRDMLLVHKIN